VRRYVPEYEHEYARRGWEMFPSLIFRTTCLASFQIHYGKTFEFELVMLLGSLNS
jgi:hypothetical protein